jgi:hypothetical protein
VVYTSSVEQEPQEHDKPDGTPKTPVELAGTSETAELPSFNELPEWLGFVESAEMITARQDWLEAIRNGADNARDLGIRYQELAEAADAEQLAAYKQTREVVNEWVLRENESEGTDDVLATAAEAGYVETPEMRLLRARIRLTIATEPTKEASKEPPVELARQYDKYHDLANKQQGAYDGKLQVGLLLAKAMAWRDAGKIEFFKEDIDDILVFTQGLRDTHGSPFNEIVDVILKRDNPTEQA